jgi:hypothetical protein
MSIRVGWFLVPKKAAKMDWPNRCARMQYVGAERVDDDDDDIVEADVDAVSES